MKRRIISTVVPSYSQLIKAFNASTFEKQLPFNMRYKEFDIEPISIANGWAVQIVWWTQEFFSAEEAESFFDELERWVYDEIGAQFLDILYVDMYLDVRDNRGRIPQYRRLTSFT